MRKGIQYHEVQQFRQSWLWFLLVISTLISLVPLLVFTLQGEIPVKEGILAIGGVLMLMLINLMAFYYIRLETKINDEGIAYRWWPVFRKFSLLPWDQIEYVSMQKNSAFQYGYHIDRKLGKVHNVDGNQGYQVVLRNGKKYYFGTQRKLSVESVLEQAGKLRL